MRKRILSLMLIMLLACSLLGCGKKTADERPENGQYELDVELEGGTGKATVESAIANVADDEIILAIVWSSKNYDYMIVGGEKYLNESEVGEKSAFSFPVDTLTGDVKVTADTTAMSTPHEIDYILHLSLKE